MQRGDPADRSPWQAWAQGRPDPPRLYAVGRPGPADGTTLIPISQTRAVRVFANEVFAADEAAVIFYTYYLTDAVAQPYVLRELDLSQELSEQR